MICVVSEFTITTSFSTCHQWFTRYYYKRLCTVNFFSWLEVRDPSLSLPVAVPGWLRATGPAPFTRLRINPIRPLGQGFSLSIAVPFRLYMAWIAFLSVTARASTHVCSRGISCWGRRRSGMGWIAINAAKRCALRFMRCLNSQVRYYSWGGGGRMNENGCLVEIPGKHSKLPCSHLQWRSKSNFNSLCT